ncbi:helix-turn-helix domain-containing protein [Pleomorphomonas koreensis]|uniref:helix-turn-helix domain-containing protein n=1 Tax=Pleomorphomonas koreensis TaxID=257440 RepID=UPI000A02F386
MTRVWTPHQIKAALADRGYTLAAVDKLGDQEGPFYEGAARKAIRGLHFRAAAVIAGLLEQPFAEIFPGMYLSARANRPAIDRSALSDPSHKSSGESRQTRTSAVDRVRAA